MRDKARSLAWSAAGALGGATGLLFARCAGGACSACLACAVPGAGLVLLAVLRRRAEAPAAPVDAASTATHARPRLRPRARSP